MIYSGKLNKDLFQGLSLFHAMKNTVDIVAGNFALAVVYAMRSMAVKPIC